MDQILYKVPVPLLAEMTEEQRNRAIEEYMRESQRQLRMIFDALGIKDTEQEAATTNLNKALKDLKERDADYVEDRGTDGVWTWEKWNSGKAECWGDSELTVTRSAWTAAGNVFCADGTEALPDGLFNSAPDVTPSIKGKTDGNFAGWAGCFLPSDSTTAKYRIYRHNNYATTSTVLTHLLCVGTWK